MSLSCEGEVCSVWRESIRRARKQHCCSACRAVIRPGDFYSYTFCVNPDAGPETIRRCGSCEVTYRHLVAQCDAYNKTVNLDDARYSQADLGCALAYEDEWGDLPSDLAALPFLGADERSALLVKP